MHIKTISQVATLLVGAFLVVAGCAEESGFEKNTASQSGNRENHAETLRERKMVYTWVREQKNDKFIEYLVTNPGFSLSYKGMYNVYEYAALSNNVEALKSIDERYQIECDVAVSSLQLSLSAPAGMSVMDSIAYLISKKTACLTEETKNELVFYVFDGANAETIQGFSRLHPFSCDSFDSKTLSSALFGGVSVAWISMMYECGVRLDDQSQQFWNKVWNNYPDPTDRKLIEKLKTSS